MSTPKCSVLTLDVLAKLLDLDPDRGTLRWRFRSRDMFAAEREFKRWNARYAGSAAFTALDSGGYRSGQIFGQPYLAHRVIWCLHTGAWPKVQVDHANGCRSDNRIINLREATRSQNSQNRKSHAGSTSVFTGVALIADRQRWRATISVKGRNRYLGSFMTEVEAAAAYDSAARLNHRDFARINLIEVAA